VLSASGSASVLNRRLNGEMAIDLVDGLVGVPLKLAGTLDEPQLSLTGGALAGAAVGTAVLPGVGTAIGARVGQQVEKLFGGEDDKKKPQRPAPSKVR
jgi:phage tail tape-measure protein